MTSLSEFTGRGVHSPGGLTAAFETAIEGEHRRERELIFLCARTRMDSVARARAHELIDEGLNWTYVQRGAHFHGVSALVYLSIRNELAERVPHEVFEQMRKRFSVSGVAVHALVDEFAQIAKSFEALGIPLMLFKGPALAQRAYGDISRRKPGDLDILVHKEDFLRASRVLVDRGYGLDGIYQRGLQFEGISTHIDAKKGVTFYNGFYAVDLHWTLDDHPFPVNLDLREIWKRSEAVTLKRRPVASLSIEDQLHFLCCHGAKHNWSRISMICDIAELLRSNLPIEWDHVLDTAHKTRRTRMLYLALTLANDLMDAPVPDFVRRHVRRDWRIRFLARKIGGGLYSDVRSADIHIARLLLLEPFREKAAYLAHRWTRSQL